MRAIVAEQSLLFTHDSDSCSAAGLQMKKPLSPVLGGTKCPVRFINKQFGQRRDRGLTFSIHFHFCATLPIIASPAVVLI